MGTALLDHRLLFVTGKGGVGRTTVAAALAMLAAEQGKRTLVCQLDPSGGLPDALDTGPLGFEPSAVEEGLWAMSMDTEASLREYLRLNLRIPLVARLGPLAHAFDFVANAAPGVKEILTVGKVCYEVREGNWDLVVVDASPSGQVIGQLDAPQAINELVKVGLVRDQTTWMNEILSDASQTGCVIVTTPEEMPVSETLELVERLRAQTRVSLAAVVVNRVLPELFGRREEEAFRRLASPDGLLALSSALGEDVSPLFSAASLAVTLRRTGAGHLERLRAGTDPNVPLIYLPYLFSRSHGLRATRQLCAALSSELAQ